VSGGAINSQRPIATDANTLISALGAQRTWRDLLLASSRSKLTLAA
jgi:hypothetical protein